jgi:hypothetical protein
VYNTNQAKIRYILRMKMNGNWYLSPSIAYTII